MVENLESVDLTEAITRLDELIDRAAKGETIQILRDGRPVALLTPPRKPIDVEMLKRIAAGMPFQTESAGDFIRRIRDEDRY